MVIAGTHSSGDRRRLGHTKEKLTQAIISPLITCSLGLVAASPLPAVLVHGSHVQLTLLAVSLRLAEVYPFILSPFLVHLSLSGLPFALGRVPCAVTIRIQTIQERHLLFRQGPAPHVVVLFDATRVGRFGQTHVAMLQ